MRAGTPRPAGIDATLPRAGNAYDRPEVHLSTRAESLGCAVYTCRAYPLGIVRGVSRMLPKPRADLKPNTADFERLPLVKPTGFREYDARWLFPAGDQPDGPERHRARAWRRWSGERGRARSASSSATTTAPTPASVKQALIDGLLAGGARGARHRPRAVADGLLRPVRARCRGRGHGHRQPQRQRLDRHQDGLRTAR